MARHRNEDVFDSVTTSLCSVCAETVPARIVRRGTSVHLLKRCPAHGPHEELLEEDAKFYMRRDDYRAPPTPSSVDTEIRLGCPHDCGLCPDHAQHTCIGLIEVTNACDAACPICYARAGGNTVLDLATIGKMLDAYLEAESGNAEILQISGGEPTTHPQIVDIIRLARNKGIRYVMLNTNGIRLAEEPGFAESLAEFHGGFEIYLQFDGFDPKASRAFRGTDRTGTHQRALDRLAATGVPATLVNTVEAGVNDDQLGRIIEFGLSSPAVRGINFQPLAYFGNADQRPSGGRVTLTGVIKRIKEQTNGMLRPDDFIPLPCDPNRVAFSYLYRQGGRFVPMARRSDLRQYLTETGNTLAFFPKDALARISESFCCGQTCSCIAAVKDLIPLIPLARRAARAKDKVAFTTENFFRVTVTSFLDRYNFDLQSMQMECVHVLTPDGRRIPFSAYNLFHRGKCR
ncbi:MAG TPA: radical SAM protein [Armatimonadota bacterium]|jgi:hypothetical protein